MSTAKSTLHAYLMSKGQSATYTTQAIREPTGPGLPGLVPMRTSFVSTVILPDSSTYTSGAFARKKDAEQDAARIVLEQLGLSKVPAAEKLGTDEEKWAALRERVVASFAVQCVLSYRPLMEHFRSSMRVKTERRGHLPASALSALNTKILGICKGIDPSSDLSPARVVALVLEAAKTCPTLDVHEDTLCISRKEVYGSHVEVELLKGRHHRPTQDDMPTQTSQGQFLLSQDTNQFGVVYVPASLEKMVKSLQINLGADEYYMDAFAGFLGSQHSGHVLMSRPVAKTKGNNGIRLYWQVPASLLESTADFLAVGSRSQELSHQHQNNRASILTGYPVYGDAILASAGSDWRSEGILRCDDVTLACYYRLVLGKSPEGSYKLSRDAVLAAELPSTYTSRSQWHGGLPRSILTEFCKQQRLAEPSFWFCSENSDVPLEDVLMSGQGDSSETDQTRMSGSLDSSETDQTSPSLNSASDGHMSEKEHPGPFKCKVRVTWNDGTTIEHSSEGFFRSQTDARHSASLKALVQMASLFSSSSYLLGYHHPFRVVQWNLNGYRCYPESGMILGVVKDCNSETGVQIVDEGNCTGKLPSPGSVACINYTVHIQALPSKEFVPVEACDNFEFELGTNAVVPQLEFCVANMSVGQAASFFIPSPAHGLLLAACGGLADESGHLHTSGLLKYMVKLTSYQEPPEDRMECAHFSPPLSKQRMEFALKLIQAIEAKSLIDIGCGSGSLLDVLIDHPSSLETMSGVDISNRSLVRAAKSVDMKLTKRQHDATEKLIDVTLYEGSLADFDPRLRSPDIATCVEVVEHMDPEPLLLFGEVVLGRISPKVLLVSTPNIEYNPVLQGLPWNGSIDYAEVKLRNDDHRFEWTRAEFRAWADNLANEFGYRVEYSGVGGSGEEVGPGFASQIAVFTRLDGHSQSSCYGTNEEISAALEVPAKGLQYRLMYSWRGKAKVA